MAAARAVRHQRYEPIARLMARAVPMDVVFFVDTSVPAVALTFDDGPHPDTTPALLDVLEAHDALATFFLVGQRILVHQELLLRITDGGHELGNHLMRDAPSIGLTGEEFRADLQQVTSLLEPYGAVRYFRPGSGWFSPGMLAGAREQGLRCVLGTAVVDNRQDGDPVRLARWLLRQARPGLIAVLHEGSLERCGVVTTTDHLLRGLRSSGLRTVTVSELLELSR
jgi:peptidoglycan/xylan/chitin deacetylase (PgdA/CDA1 family)